MLQSPATQPRRFRCACDSPPKPTNRAPSTGRGGRTGRSPRGTAGSAGDIRARLRGHRSDRLQPRRMVHRAKGIQHRLPAPAALYSRLAGKRWQDDRAADRPAMHGPRTRPRRHERGRGPESHRDGRRPHGDDRRAGPRPRHRGSTVDGYGSRDIAVTAGKADWPTVPEARDTLERPCPRAEGARTGVETLSVSRLRRP